MNQGWSHVILSRMQNAHTSVSPRPCVVSPKRGIAVRHCAARRTDRAGVRGRGRSAVVGRRRGGCRLHAAGHAVGLSLADTSQRRAAQLCGGRGAGRGLVGDLGTRAAFGQHGRLLSRQGQAARAGDSTPDARHGPGVRGRGSSIVALAWSPCETGRRHDRIDARHRSEPGGIPAAWGARRRRWLSHHADGGAFFVGHG